MSKNRNYLFTKTNNKIWLQEPFVYIKITFSVGEQEAFYWNTKTRQLKEDIRTKLLMRTLEQDYLEEHENNTKENIRAIQLRRTREQYY